MSLRDQIEQFLYREARLMDEHRFEDWEALWTEEGVYWVPCAHDGTPDSDVALIYADRAALTRRLMRMKSGAMYAQDPRSVLARLVGNVEIYPDGDDAALVHSTFNLTEFRRRGHQTWLRTWAGRSEHHLRRVNGDWKMAFKKVLLVNSDGETPALGFLV